MPTRIEWILGRGGGEEDRLGRGILEEEKMGKERR